MNKFPQKLVLGVFLAGLVARWLAGFFVYGAQSVDDYSHGLLPTIEGLRGLSYDLPPWRSPLLVWILTPWAQLGAWLGIQSQFALIQWILLGLGCFAGWGLWVASQWAEREWERSPDLQDRRTLLLGFGLWSLHFLMVFASTRAFGESIALTLVLVGFIWLQEKRYWWGAIALGVACLFRFQIGVLGFGWVAIYLYQKNGTALRAMIGGGLVSAGLAALVDLIYGRWPLETLAQYLNVNKGGAVEHSVQPWYNTWTTVLLVFLIPFTIPFLRSWRRLRSFEKEWALLVLFFVFLHSLIPHKEERFMFPILPIVLWMLAAFWSHHWESFYERRLFRPFLILLLSFGLIVAVTSNSQRGEYEPIKRADAEGRPVLIWDLDSPLSISFFRHRLVRDPVEYRHQANWPTADELSAYAQHTIFLTTSSEERLEALLAQGSTAGTEVGSAVGSTIASLLGRTCDKPLRIQSVADRVIYHLNPKYNVRRAPTWLLRCPPAA